MTWTAVSGPSGRPVNLVYHWMMTILRRLLPATILILFAAPPAAAQSTPTFPTDDQNLVRIWRLGMDSSHVQRLAQVLFDSVGPRLTGSPGYAAAGD